VKVKRQTLLEDSLPLETATTKETHITRQASEKTIDNGALQRKPGSQSRLSERGEVKATVPTVPNQSI